MTRTTSVLSDTLLERFRDSRRVGRLAGADARGESVGTVCGDRVELTLRRADGRVADARFLAEGCAVAIAAAAAVASAVVGREAIVGAVEKSELEALLGGIPRGREACAYAAVAALDAALGVGSDAGRP